MISCNKVFGNRIMFMILICIAFLSYRAMEFYSSDLANIEKGVAQELELKTSDNNMISSTNEHIFDQLVHQSVNETVGIVSDQFINNDKSGPVSVLLKFVTYLMIPFILMQLIFLCVRRWLIKTFYILKYNVPSIIYLHKKDGKKKCYPFLTLA